MVGIAKGRGLGVDLVFLFTDVGVAQDRQTFGIGGHEAVLDAVVHHLDEMASAGRPAVQVALFGRATDLLASWGARDVAWPRRQGLENGIEPPHGLVRPSDHHAITALQAPDSAAGSDVYIIDLLGC